MEEVRKERTHPPTFSRYEGFSTKLSLSLTAARVIHLGTISARCAPALKSAAIRQDESFARWACCTRSFPASMNQIGDSTKRIYTMNAMTYLQVMREAASYPTRRNRRCSIDCKRQEGSGEERCRDASTLLRPLLRNVSGGACRIAITRYSAYTLYYAPYERSRAFNRRRSSVPSFHFPSKSSDKRAPACSILRTASTTDRPKESRRLPFAPLIRHEYGRIATKSLLKRYCLQCKIVVEIS